MYIKPFLDIYGILTLNIKKVRKLLFLSSNEKPFSNRFGPKL
jgi:hypothetical protein